MKKPRVVIVVSWGPVESLSNGYFIRVYQLLEIMSRIFDTIQLIEFTENLKEPWQITTFKRLNNIIKIKVPGNKLAQNIAQKITKYFAFFIYQLLIIIKLRELFKHANVMVTCGSLFIVLHIVRKYLTKQGILIADPQMWLYERAEREGRSLLARLLIIFEKIYIKTSDLVFLISDRDREVARKLTSKNHNVIIIPHMFPSFMSINNACFSVKFDRIENDVLNIGFVGDYYSEHNVRSLKFIVSILAPLAKHLKLKTRFYLIGRGDKEWIDRLIDKYKVKDNVSYVGFVKDLDLYICNNIDILVAPVDAMSGVSTKMLLYLRYNKPIIATKQVIEGIPVKLLKRKDIIVAEDLVDFVKKFIKMVRNLGA